MHAVRPTTNNAKTITDIFTIFFRTLLPYHKMP
nr:MAG TPA: hypothetical protein [Bacteriophage sp.]